jgi:hypothetical protein
MRHTFRTPQRRMTSATQQMCVLGQPEQESNYEQITGHRRITR